MSKTDNYYVYVYLREDGNPPSPYYVGKGKDKRFQARHGRKYTNNGYWNPPKEENIRFVKTNLTDAEAIELEKKLIKQYGRKDNNTGILRNFTDGGEGSSGRIVKQETRELWSKQRTGRKLSPETCAKISERFKGQNNPMFGKRKRYYITVNYSVMVDGIAKKERGDCFLYQRHESPFWYCGFHSHGQIIRTSTGKIDEKEAETFASNWYAKQAPNSTQIAYELTQPKEGNLYLIKATEKNNKNSPCKIGITLGIKPNAPESRLKSLQTSHYNELKLVYKSPPLDNIHQIETMIHKKYKNKKIRGEWFNIDQNDINDIIIECNKMTREKW